LDDDDDDDDDDDAGRLKQVGKKRVRRSYSGWLEISVQPRLTSCQHQHHHHQRRRRGRRARPLTPLALLLRVSDVARATPGDVHQLVSTPVKCSSSTTQLDTDDQLGTQQYMLGLYTTPRAFSGVTYIIFSANN